MTAYLPIQTISELNQRGVSKLAAILKAKRIKAQRSETFYHLLATWGHRVPPLPLSITLTRVSPRALDTDNLTGALKAVRDGVADWLCGKYDEGEDRQAGLTWGYTQQPGRPREQAVLITLKEERMP